eukprot:scaffold6029_cov63-Phaeocystis_antarctica.AAC.10
MPYLRIRHWAPLYFKVTPLLPFHYPRPLSPRASSSQRRHRCTSTCTNAEVGISLKRGTPRLL